MKTTLKKMAAVIMAATTLTVGTAVANMSTYAVNVETDSPVIETNSPRYTKCTTVPFNVTSMSPKSDSFTVTNTPAKLTYCNCTTGAALVTVEVNNSVYGRYVIPETSGATTANITINCSKGDTISYTVAPYSAGHYVKAIGSFSIYY
jgi:hypothetical protein